MKYNEKENMTTISHCSISKIIDGDSIIIQNLFSKKEQEIRLYGIDAPEIKRCAKLLQDERETHLAGFLLMHLGRLSLNYLLKIAPVKTPCTILQEFQNTTDVYGRTLAYLFLPDGSCINKAMIEEGYAKPYSKIFCKELPSYQMLNTFARQEKKGLYSIVKSF
jgi:micrococcal nuclease